MRFLILTFLFGCGTHKPVPVKESSDWERVQEKRDNYKDWAQKTVDDYGWLGHGCDGLLFNSLAAYARFPVNPLIAEEAPGRWRRHPDFSICSPGKGSASTVSRDMFRGLFIYLLAMQDRDALVRIREYGETHGWVMGEGPLSRTLFNPVIKNQLDRMIDKTVPKDQVQQVAYPTDFEAHLDFLRVYTEFLIYGKITDSELQTLKYYSESYPRNALFQALYHKFTDGDQADALAILLDETLFPADRLPTQKDHYTHYLWQRDPGPDWEPCVEGGESQPCEGLTHPGIDFIFAVSVIER